MLKLWLPVIIFISLILGKCNQSAMNADIKSGDRVYLNNEQLDLSDETFKDLNNSLFTLIETCDDFYEQLVTNDYVDQIKKTEKYLELIYSSPIEINVGGREIIAIDRIMIPLSGKFQSDNEVSFFLGKELYSIHPYVNSNGMHELNKILQNLN
jgi:hypothetical protein